MGGGDPRSEKIGTPMPPMQCCLCDVILETLDLKTHVPVIPLALPTLQTRTQ